MADLLDRLAEELARDTLEQVRLTGDEDLVTTVAKSLGDTSTTFQETFLTAVRYYSAEARARAFLPDFKSDDSRALPAPEAIPSRSTPVEEDSAPGEADSKPNAAQKADKPADDGNSKDKQAKDRAEEGDEIPFADAEIVEDDEEVPFVRSKPHVGTGNRVPKPKLSPENAETPSVEPEITGPRKSRR